MKMTSEEFDRRRDEFPPDRFDFRWNERQSEVTVVSLSWWDDASYLAYQGDQLDGGLG